MHKEMMLDTMSEEMRLDTMIRDRLHIDPALLRSPRRDFRRRVLDHTLPIVITRYQIEHLEHARINMRFQFRHPCPCRGWALDRLVQYSVIVFEEGIAHLGVGFIFRQAKKEMRREATKHILEFLQVGTMDGERVL